MLAGSLLFASSLASAQETTKAKTKTLQLQPIPCTPGKGPRAGVSPMMVCARGVSIKEVGKDVKTNSVVRIETDGQIEVCSDPVALDLNCKPKHNGKIALCGLSLDGTCSIFEKDEDTSVNFEALAKAAADPEAVKDFVVDAKAAALAERMRYELARGSGNGATSASFDDPWGVLESMEGEIQNAGRRIVTLPADRISDLIHGNDLSSAARKLVEASGQGGVPLPLNPVLEAAPPVRYASEPLAEYFTDSGSAITLYQSPTILNKDFLRDVPLPPSEGALYPPLPRNYGDSTFVPPLVPTVPIVPAVRSPEFIQIAQKPSWKWPQPLLDMATKVKALLRI